MEQLGDEIADLAAHIAAATARWLMLIAEFDAQAGWNNSGAKSTAHWLSWRCAVSLHTAREYVRVARRLQALPLVREAFASGRLGYSKARALTRLAEVTREHELVNFAMAATASQLERAVSAHQACLATNAEPARAHEERALTWRFDDVGSVRFQGQLPADDAALLIAAIESVRARLDEDRTITSCAPPNHAAEQPAGACEPNGAPPMTCAASALAQDESDESWPNPSPSPASNTPATRFEPVAARRLDALMSLVLDRAAHEHQTSTGADRCEVIVHVDAEDLTEAETGAGRAETSDGFPVAREAVRRLCCDSGIVTLAERDGKALSVGRRRRTVPPAIRRALRDRDRTCRFPGCGQRRHVDAHHIRHWIDGGHTSLENLLTLCRHHHRLVHECGFSVGREGDEVVFRAPDGRRLRAVPKPRAGSLARLRDDHHRRGVAPSVRSLVASDGGSMDLGLAVDALAAWTAPLPLPGGMAAP
jgi:hypothetical protein